MKKILSAGAGSKRRKAGARTAIVLGGSMAGSWTARALAEHFSRVIVVERDERVRRLFLDASHLMRPPANLFIPGALWRLLPQTPLRYAFHPGTVRAVRGKAKVP